MIRLNALRWAQHIALAAALTFASGGIARADEGGQPAPQPEREWTFLVFLNGHNNLDSFGLPNVRDMEKVGSTEKVNVVVQWASMRFSKTKRIFVNKQTNSGSSQLASTVVEELPTVDMGDYRKLVEFIKWGVQKYPAKRYFVNVWNHGGGWHVNPNAMTRAILHPTDISWDDRTGNVITTEQLGQAMAEVSQFLGRKLDLYGSDACLMAMAEVAAEMSNSVEASVGSQDVEPGAGWPYDKFLAKWNQLADQSPLEVGKALVQTYVASYTGGSNGTQDVTLSVFDLTKMAQFNDATRAFGAALTKVPAASMQKVLRHARASQAFTYTDYVDVVDFANRLAGDAEFRAMTEIADVKSAAQAFTTYNEASRWFKGAYGLSIWLPTDSYTRRQYAARYTGLAFDKATTWSQFLAAMIP